MEQHDCRPPHWFISALLGLGTKFFCPTCNTEWVRERSAKWGTYWSTMDDEGTERRI